VADAGVREDSTQEFVVDKHELLLDDPIRTGAVVDFGDIEGVLAGESAHFTSISWSNVTWDTNPPHYSGIWSLGLIIRVDIEARAPTGAVAWRMTATLPRRKGVVISFKQYVRV
jgi:hypothetical protein